MQLGLDLLHAMKNELGITPSRKCLDFLLHACGNAKDLKNARLIWKEYEATGLPYNTLSFLRWIILLLGNFNFLFCFVSCSNTLLSCIGNDFVTTGFQTRNACRMYQALLAGGDRKAARTLRGKMPKDDPHVRYIIQACKTAYSEPKSRKKKKK